MDKELIPKIINKRSPAAIRDKRLTTIEKDKTSDTSPVTEKDIYTRLMIFYWPLSAFSFLSFSCLASESIKTGGCWSSLFGMIAAVSSYTNILSDYSIPPS